MFDYISQFSFFKKYLYYPSQQYENRQEGIPRRDLGSATAHILIKARTIVWRRFVLASYKSNHA